MKRIIAILALGLAASSAAAQSYSVPQSQRLVINQDGSYQMLVGSAANMGKPTPMQAVWVEPGGKNLHTASRNAGQCVRVYRMVSFYIPRTVAYLCGPGSWQDSQSPVKVSVSDYTASGYTLTVAGLPPPGPTYVQPGGSSGQPR